MQVYVIDRRTLVCRQFGDEEIAATHIEAELDGGLGAGDDYLVFFDADQRDVVVGVSFMEPV